MNTGLNVQCVTWSDRSKSKESILNKINRSKYRLNKFRELGVSLLVEREEKILARLKAEMGLEKQNGNK